MQTFILRFLKTRQDATGFIAHQYELGPPAYGSTKPALALTEEGGSKRTEDCRLSEFVGKYCPG